MAVNETEKRRGRAGRRRRPVGPGEWIASCVVIAALCVIAIVVLVRQNRFNPAVAVSLREGPLPGRVEGGGEEPKSGPALFLNGTLPEMSPASAVEVFGSETLSDKIDGKAELYLPSGFKAMACRSFSTGSGARVEIFIYEMESPNGAFAVFSGQRRSGSESSSLAKDAYGTENALFFTSGVHYVELVADRAGDAVKKELEGAGAAILAALPKSASAQEPADERGLFPRGGIVEESVRLTVSDAFGLEGLDNIYSAEYRLPSGEVSAFLSLRATPDEASALTEKYVKFLAENGYRKVSSEGFPSGAAVYLLDNVHEVVMPRGRLFAGVHEATSLQSAKDLAQALDEGLQGKIK